MGISWGGMRKVLEQDNICDSLRGRIQYFVTRYRESHDKEGRVAIRLDGKEIFQSCFFDWHKKRDIVIKNSEFLKVDASSYWDYWNRIHLETKNYGGFDQYVFYRAFYEYQNQSIKCSLSSSDPVIRLFAILDQRTGKRSLHKLLATIQEQPQWLQVFYKLRLESEGISLTV